MIWLLLATGIFAADHLIKRTVTGNRKEGEKEPLFGGKLTLRYIRNYGFAMSTFRKYPEFVRMAAGAVTGLMAAVFAWALIHPGSRLKKCSLAMIVGGGACNLYDRVKRGFVVDYVSFRTGCRKLNDLVFNISDFFIIGGSVLYCISQSLKRK